MPSSDLVYPESAPRRVPFIHSVPPRRGPAPFRRAGLAAQWDKDTAAIARQSRLTESMEAARHRRSLRVCNIIAAVCAIGAVLALIIAVISSLAV